MSTHTTSSLLETLVSCNVLDASQLDQLLPSLSNVTDPKTLVRALVSRGLLTHFQANRVAQGKTRELVLGSYVLVDKIGAGGMGQVFLARQQLMNRNVALKVIRQGHATDPDMMARFRREMAAVARVSHPNIVTAFHAEQLGDTLFFVMEYVRGTDLAHLVTEHGALPIDQASSYVYQTALGLQHIHECQMIHRDIKPANLLVTADGQTIKILDLGLARLHQDSERNSGALTAVGAVMGTPDYIAPEQTRDAGQADIRADIYSLGCSFYHLLTGKPPFPRGSVVDKFVKHREIDPVPAETIRCEIPRGVGELVRKMMAKKPEDRFATPGELAEALQKFCHQGASDSWIRPVLKASRALSSLPASALHSTIDSEDTGHSPQVNAGPPTTNYRAAQATIQIPSRRRWRIPVLVAVGLLFLGGAIWLMAQIIITVRHPDGSETTIKPAKGSKVVVDGDGKITIVPPKKKATGGKKPVPVVKFALVETIPSFPNQELEITVAGNKSAVRKGKHLLPLHTGTHGLQIVAKKQTDTSYYKKDYYKKELRLKAGDRVSIALTEEKPWVSSRTWSSGDSSINLLCANPQYPSQFATASVDYLAKTWDLHRTSPLKTFKGNRHLIMGLLYSANGEQLFTGGNDCYIRCYNTANGQILYSLAEKPHVARKTLAVWASKGKNRTSYLASGTYGKQCDISIWNLRRRRIIHRLKGHKHKHIGLTFTPDGKYLISGSWDGTVRIWDWRNEKVLKTLEVAGVCSDCAPVGKNCLLIGRWSAFAMWDMWSGQRLFQKKHLGKSFVKVCVSPDRNWMAVLHTPSISIYHQATGYRLFELPSSERIPTSATFLTGKDCWLVVGYRDGTITAWDLRHAQANKQFTFPGKVLRQRTLTGQKGEVFGIAIQSLRKHVVSASQDHQIRVWDRDKLTEVPTIRQGHKGPVTSVEGRFRLLSASMDGTVKLWSGKGEEVLSFLADPKGVRSAARSPDTKLIATGGETGTAILWDAQTGEKVRVLKGHTGPVRSVAFSWDGKQLASASEDGTIKLWALADNDKVQTLKGHKAAVTCVRFQVNDTHLISSSEDGTCILWDLKTGKAKTFRGHSDKVTCVANSLDNRWFASGSADKTIKLWNVQTGKELLTLTGHSKGVNCIDISRDSKWIVSGGKDETVRHWELGFSNVEITPSKTKK